ncbi:hypothetical protein [Desulfosporosinus metallidurans]|uniref:Zn-finger domain associated with topoisomerase type I n=1 Tax=Desulfosporosinus metallidurans TaxID=1888891 RepID=A0A1Q8R1R1_9FIRM|nr:hypothetical protein [Desulfosporosinus metallidurans]OLN33593.1 Zn-finger domain associated with topoisomerase type I [Desulfosporosinus metallidurans]
MEAYFHNDPRIEEWIDQITEKIFTVCLLSGVDSDAEFQRGSQIVTKVTSLLLGISMFPTEYLEDGLRQLLEQQLPDERVINNFPLFQDTMDKMLRDGMSKAMDTQPKEALNSTVSYAKENTKEVIREVLGENTGRPWETFNEENVIESVIPAVAIENAFHHDIQEGEFVVETEADTESNEEGPERLDLAVITMDSALDFERINDKRRNVELEMTEIDSISDDILCKLQVPDLDNRLRHVLNKVFPNGPVCWNLKVNNQTFLAQVEDILIYLHDPKHPCLVENFNKRGWKVFVCSAEDLSFPRRLERGIRQILRSGKNSTIV